jgi:formate dehydrogenase iron-sulfur subunit
MNIEPMGFFTDTTVCIGCRACEVACKQWNRLPAATNGGTKMSGHSYDNTLHLDNLHWRHVRFHEDFEEGAATPRWLMMSDSCKHCRDAACLAACPEQAIIRTEFDSVFIRPDKCKGHWACADACPFGVIQPAGAIKIARKCTLCYDRIRDNLPPACAKACPTDSIRFGTVAGLIHRAENRVRRLHQQGVEEAYLYGLDKIYSGGLSNFYLLLGAPETYRLPDF